jgi:folylpolyglutamate synthase/dihydropteroate synthase
MDKAEVKAAFSELNHNIIFDLAEMPEALERAKKLAEEKNKTLIVAGSLYLVGEVLSRVKKNL